MSDFVTSNRTSVADPAPSVRESAAGDAGMPEVRRGRSPSQVLWRKLRRNRTAMLGLYTLVVLYLAAILAGFVAPYSSDNSALDFSFHPPLITRLHVLDQQGALTRPFVYGSVVDENQVEKYHDDQSKMYPIRLFVRGDDYHILWVIKTNVHLFGVDAPGRICLLGADQFGRDVFSRILYGGQISLSVGIVGIVISTVIGMLIGGMAGYFGGPVDFLSMRFIEVLLALPSLYFILILRKMFDNVSSTQMYLIIIIILSLLGWATEARVIRGMVLSLKQQEYVIAARALGFGNARIIIRHILPNTLSFVIVTATLSVPFYILGEVALSFLGVGITDPDASWGNMLAQAQVTRTLVYFPWVLTPGFFIFLAVMAWNFLGDGLRDAADPRTRS